jgi:carboxypeptidase C (cathepsin A)
MYLRAMMSGAALAVLVATAGAAAAQVRTIPALANGDEVIVVTEHRIQTKSGPLAYTAMVGRIPVRNDESGEIRGWIGFTAYSVKPKAGEVRPLSFAWNGGGPSSSSFVHTVGFGPRVIKDVFGDSMVDNPDTLLQTTDLVFYDPVTTGFSRPAKPEYAQEFLTTLGDFAATTEFIRAYRAKFGVHDQPVFLIGESTGSWRAAGVQDIMTKRHDRIAGSILVSASGGATSILPYSYTQAGYVQPRTAAAYHFKRLSPELMKDRAATLKLVGDWSYQTYEPALANLDKLTPAEREKIAQELARFTGMPADSIDRKTLVMTNNEFRQGFFKGDKAKVLGMHDMRELGETRTPDDGMVAGYIRDELGYHTDLTYAPREPGYETTPAPANQPPKPTWIWNHTPGGQAEAERRAATGGGPPPALHWLESAMGADKKLRVMITTGVFDSLNGCAANAISTAKFAPDISARFTHGCYEGGHMMYQDVNTRAKLNGDIQIFIKSTVVSGGWIAKN